MRTGIAAMAAERGLARQQGAMAQGVGMAAPVGKPIPVPDKVTQPFWDATREGRLVVQRCEDCKRFQHPPEPLCFACGSAAVGYEAVSGRGRIQSYSITYDTRDPAFESLQPYPVVLVSLEEQDDLIFLTNMPGVPLEGVAIDVPVMVEFEEIAEGVSIPQFRPVEEERQ
jgi:uncharacterized OB-fold protein